MSPHNIKEAAKKAKKAEYQRDRTAKVRASETPQECAERKAKYNEYQRTQSAKKKESETPEERAARRAKKCETRRKMISKLTPEDREERKADINYKQNARRAADPQKYRDRQTANRAANPQKCREREVARYAADPQKAREKGRVNGQKRRARKLAAPGAEYATKDMIASRWQMYGGSCWMCGKEAVATDHVKPLSAGGSHFPSNLRPACTSCNSSKSAKWPYPTTTIISKQRVA